MLELALRGGTVIDGTGAPPVVADVGIAGGRIVEVGRQVGPAHRSLDVTGLVVAPGVVDIHTHYDAQLFWDPAATPSCFHGVTTVIGGNCGFTLAPVSPEDTDYLIRLMARVEGMPIDALTAGLPWDWRSFPEWLSRLDGRLAVNAGFLCGHTALRRAVMGSDAVGQPASPEQVAAMAELLDQALGAGALGFSSSQTPNHNDGDGRPIPTRSATRRELLDLASVVATRPGTTLEWILAGGASTFSHDEVDLLASLSLAADRPLNWNALGVSTRDPGLPDRQLAASRAAAGRGATVVALSVPHLVRLRLNFDTGFILDGLPGWAETMALPVAQRCQALADPEVRERLAAGAASEEAGLLQDLVDWNVVTVVETVAPQLQDAVGHSGAELAAQRGGSAFDALLDVAIADGLQTGFAASTLGDDDATWRQRAEVWRDPHVVLGASDAGAHLDLMCGAEYSTAHLGTNVRDRELLPLTEAVHQLTDVPARLYGLRGRGRVAPGWAADLMVFDPDTVAPQAALTRHDLPAGCARLYAEATGMPHVLVNGQLIVEDGELGDALPGTLLRSGRDTDTVTAGASWRS